MGFFSLFTACVIIYISADFDRADIENFYQTDAARAKNLQTWLLFYSLECGDYPVSLHCGIDGKCKDSAGVREKLFDDEPGRFVDVWGRPFHYIKTADGYVLFCLGKDGLIGGSGLDEDIVVGPRDWADARKIPND
jgi:hypothetical protein